MIYYFIVCRSLTQAQRALMTLERAGISAQLLRSPAAILREGCSHCVKLAEKNLSRSLRALAQAGLSPKQIFMQEGDGSYQEVLL